jgi:hypothetical protein
MKNSRYAAEESRSGTAVFSHIGGGGRGDQTQKLRQEGDMSGGGGRGRGVNTPDSNESRNFTHVVHSTWCPPPRAAPDVGGRGG